MEDQKRYFTRKMVMPAHLNGANTLFGGQALAWIDEECAVFAACQLGRKSLVTKLMSTVNFMNPAFQGDIVEIGTEVISIGRTSITLSCSLRNKTTQKDIVLVDKIVFVAVDEQGIPTPHGKSKE